MCVVPLVRNKVVLNIRGDKQGRHKGTVLSGGRTTGRDKRLRMR